jgi:hypothetical protein
MAAIRKVDVAHVQRFVFCPQCRFEELGDIVSGCLEVDHGWSLRVSGPGASPTIALRALRGVAELANVPLKTLARRLEAEHIIVGPFTGAEAVKLQAHLRAAGLTAEIFGD